MEIKFNTESLSYCAEIYSETLMREETAETVIPDTMPDIARLLTTETSVFMRSKTVQDGRILLEGVVNASVLFAGEQGGIHKLDVQLPCAFTVENGEFSEQDKACARFSVISAEARTLNPRKIVFRAEIAAEISVYRSAEMELCVSAEEGSGLETLIEEKKISYISAIEEKSFVIAEEVTLPAARPAAEQILSSSVKLNAEDIRPVAEKMILQGSVQAEILYMPVEGESPVQERFSVSFSQLLDLPGGDGGLSSVVLMPTAAYIETLPGSYGANGFSLEIHVCAQSVCRAEKEIRYIADAYAPRCSCTVTSEEKCLASAARMVSLRQTIREEIPTAEAPAELCAASLISALPQIENGEVSAAFKVTLLCLSENGRFFASEKMIRLSEPVEIGENRAYSVDSIVCGEPYISLSGAAIELRLPVELRLLLTETEIISAVKMAETEINEAKAEQPSLTVVRMGSRSLWSLAKAYNSTIALIESANKGEIGAEDWLLIPRAR